MGFGLESERGERMKSAGPLLVVIGSLVEGMTRVVGGGEPTKKTWSV
jgi:hypothetical protein